MADTPRFSTDEELAQHNAETIDQYSPEQLESLEQIVQKKKQALAAKDAPMTARDVENMTREQYLKTFGFPRTW
jgi:hypothetical protein